MLGSTNASSGGTSLNLNIVGGTTRPANPAENTIWVNTNVAISSYAFMSSAPENPESGMVWFVTGASSVAAFQITEEDAIMLYPISCNQYVNGSWVNKVAESYINGEWVMWILYLYTQGDVHSDVTGGWESKEIRYASTFDQWPLEAVAPTLTFNSTNMQAQLANNNQRNFSGSILTANKIDLTPFTKIRYNFVLATSNEVRLYVSQSNTSYGAEVEQIVVGNGNKNVELDVSSLSGEFYVGMNLVAGSGYDVVTTVNVSEIAVI